MNPIKVKNWELFIAHESNIGFNAGIGDKVDVVPDFPGLTVSDIQSDEFGCKYILVKT